MLPQIRVVRPLGGHCLYLSFSDGSEGEVDLRDQIVGRGGVFESLEDPTYFSLVRVGSESGTIVWPNGVDLDPDVLHASVAKSATLAT